MIAFFLYRWACGYRNISGLKSRREIVGNYFEGSRLANLEDQDLGGFSS